MKVSQEDVRTRAWAWRGVGAGMASRFMANRALSSGARTNGAVCATPGGSRHHLSHRTVRSDSRNELCAKKALERATVRVLESSATVEARTGWNRHKMNRLVVETAS
jgi:hypothetical protein